MDDKFLETVVTQAILGQVKTNWVDRVIQVILLAAVLTVVILFIIGKYL
ncbi:hypothetical protein HOT32_gp05 [Erwinia phage Faunus]|uniref:Uncharacterized protein n=1 Tax=Erwinia phage Faunus TaxID=2182346 RepID=A0A2U8UWM8_9CAUD|nr:hypothetical protein HOT32_gp05 [Erwinia phage Faunus]AWN08588.1 hypothetical protein [Erwinia phage Faunus]